MKLNLRKLFFIISVNLFLFLFLMLGIQNSSEKHKINLIVDETIALPLSFILGVSFISGSLLGSSLLLK
tara:strand:- start:286 stop:492 length:207 start_codon:yes stop_codon:yes gene_type:complete